MLADFIVTKVNNMVLSLTQVKELTNGQIVAAVPEQHRKKLTGVILRKAKRSAVNKYIEQKAYDLASNQSFKDAVASIVPEIEITEEMIRRVIVKEARKL
jgi:hypothetical protein